MKPIDIVKAQKTPNCEHLRIDKGDCMCMFIEGYEITNTGIVSPGTVQEPCSYLDWEDCPFNKH